MRSFLLALTLVVAACGTDTDSTDSTDSTDDTEVADTNDRAGAIAAIDGDATAGETDFNDNCALCHGTDGTGGIGSDISAGGYTEAQITDIALNGTGTMNSLDTLTNQQIADISAYVASEPF